MGTSFRFVLPIFMSSLRQRVLRGLSVDYIGASAFYNFNIIHYGNSFNNLINMFYLREFSCKQLTSLQYGFLITSNNFYNLLKIDYNVNFLLTNYFNISKIILGDLTFLLMFENFSFFNYFFIMHNKTFKNVFDAIQIICTIYGNEINTQEIDILLSHIGLFENNTVFVTLSGALIESNSIINKDIPNEINWGENLNTFFKWNNINMNIRTLFGLPSLNTNLFILGNFSVSNSKFITFSNSSFGKNTSKHYVFDTIIQTSSILQFCETSFFHSKNSYKIY
jgi:hypothetical protein